MILFYRRHFYWAVNGHSINVCIYLLSAHWTKKRRGEFNFSTKVLEAFMHLVVGKLCFFKMHSVQSALAGFALWYYQTG